MDIHRTLILIFFPFYLSGVLCANQGNGEVAPNFILFYIDDLGWADTSVQMMEAEKDSKSNFYRTPNLELLAKDGMVFSNAYAPAPTCTPSRLSIQTGKTPARLRCTIVNDVMAFKEHLSWEDEISLADVLNATKQGYVSAHFGKGMGKDRMSDFGYSISDEYDSAPNGNYHGDYVDIRSRKPLPESDPKRINSLIKESREFLDEYAGTKPFFMMISHYAVHVPYAADPELIKEYAERLEPGDFNLNGYLAADQPKNTDAGVYRRLQFAAMVDQIDQHLGQVIAQLKSKGQYENTYIIYTSDNGGGLGPNGPLRYGKATLFEGGLRVPMVVRGPGVLKGARCATPVVQWDFLPTFHDLSKSLIELPEDLDGGSLRNVFEQGNAGSVERPFPGMVFHYPTYFAAPISVLRIGDYKYMKHLNSGEAKLFDMSTDYRESTDISELNDGLVEEFDGLLEDYLDQVNAYGVAEVYAARYLQLDEFERRAHEVFQQEQRKGSATKAVSLNKLEKELARFKRNREEVVLNKNSNSWIKPGIE